MINNSKIIPAKPWHCGQMIRKLRAEQREAVIGLGMNPHRELRRAYDCSAEAFAWIGDGELIGLGGVAGTLLSSGGKIWLALAETATRHPVAVAREAVRQIRRFMRTRDELVTTLLKDDGKSIKFAYLLGFEKDDDALMSEMGVVVMRIRRGH